MFAIASWIYVVVKPVGADALFPSATWPRHLSILSPVNNPRSGNTPDKKAVDTATTSKNRSKAVHHRSRNLRTPYTAELQTYASSHLTHLQVCVTPNHYPPNCHSEFQSATLAQYNQVAQTLMRHRRWDMVLGSRFLQYAQYTETSLLQNFYKRVRQCYTTAHIHCYCSPSRYCMEASGGLPP